ncbi:UBN2_3 domain-containing protein [Cucumis melo var. makuwa]|uniref:UBN2_3 domain-containing protein n=1 Tax=Cucumis melo var. makuwa TaxID=1194695 RepID=A0A5D3DZR9_CUCMM|nr:UBN2_3 domain-containing protein [Cucumis melo var. makuwa]TYK29377.1 UBN2_3 domain-containing protein [Cucumis melo var. makuwa]
MEKLLQNLQKPPIYRTGVVSKPCTLLSNQKLPHAPLLSGAWAHTPTSFHLTAHSPLHAVRCPTVIPFQPSASSHTTYALRTTLNCKSIKSVQETVWDTPNDGTQYAKLEEANRVYDFLARLNPKFDTVCSCIIEQRPLPSLMEVCFEVRLEEDHTNVMGVLTTSTIDSVAFSARSSNHNSNKNNGKSILVCEHCKKQCHTKDQCWKLHGRPLRASQTKTLTLGAIAQSGMSQSLGLISVDGKLDLRLGGYRSL